MTRKDRIIELASVSGYCRVRPYDGCATQQEIDVGYRSGLGRPATRTECFNVMMRRLRLNNCGAI